MAILITLLIYTLVIGIGFYILNAIPIAQPFKNVMLAIFGLLIVLLLLGVLVGHPLVPVYR